MSVKTLATRWPGLGLAPNFNDFFEPWNEWFHDNKLGRALTSPKVNVSENKDNYAVEVAAPGLHKKDFKIDVNGNILTISAQKEENKEDKQDKYTRQEYNYSSFSRSFTLPDDVEDGKIEANYDGGILKLTLPRDGKAAQKASKTIEIK